MPRVLVTKITIHFQLISSFFQFMNTSGLHFAAACLAKFTNVSKLLQSFSNLKQCLCLVS